MSEKSDGGPAFPAIHSIDGNWVKRPLPEYVGMSLRDYFAAAALMSGELFDARDLGAAPGLGNFDLEANRIASVAYGLADAMLKARESSK